ncbi:MAG: hypothetical protein ACR2RF_17115 [Geminicoccaceae bacterium]
MDTTGGHVNEGCELIMGNLRDQDAIEQAARHLATEIYERATGNAEASELYARAMQVLHWRLSFGLATEKFVQRAEARRLLKAERAVKRRDEKLVAQLGEFGIDPVPIFADNPRDDK